MNERPRIEAVASRHASRYAVVALQNDGPVGVERLQALAESPTGAKSS
ncbi:hypothetical protein [Methylocaldum marinum]